MPKRLVFFVEGKGDYTAVPRLAYRVIDEFGYHDCLFVDEYPMEVKGIGRLTRDNYEQWLKLIGAACKTRKELGAILLVLDGDESNVPSSWAAYRDAYGSTQFCAVQVASMLSNASREARGGSLFSVATVFAIKEFEAWLLASLPSLSGCALADNRAAVPDDLDEYDGEVENPRDAKGVLRSRIPSYRQSLDQGVLVSQLNLESVRSRSRSYRRFENAIHQIAQAVRDNEHIVTPVVQ